MIANLFSSFDPATSKIFSLNWLRILLFIFISPPRFWLIPSRWTFSWIKILLNLHNEFKILIKTKNFKGRTLIFVRLFTFILINNFLGLFPYIFTVSSHIRFTLALSIPLWLRFILFGWIKNTNHIFAHLVPQGAPRALLPFLVLVETIRNIIRPGTLAIRLTANMIAGHLLLTLLGSSGPSLNFWISGILIIAQILLLILETAVSIIQAYVFSVLATLYSRESN